MAGRPSKYRAEFAELAKNYCLLGATDPDLERFFEVSRATINEWKKQHPEFADALRAGKDIADSLVARSLYDKARGGDTTAMIFWLKNRQKHAWRDRHEIDHSGKVAVDPIQLLLSQVEGTTLKPTSK
ncbi:terminase [Paraburkholderia rhynchosiae]|uniref:Terminase n=1 Tax=Paraburkholderia rhynchosiae TaxID=487049 RepID=A0ACC7N6Z0_9BURK